ncbi:MAG: flagellar biosynthesis anti-sigma factor FlgM [Armatimonadota bacterium]
MSQVYLGKVKKVQAAETEVVQPKDKVEISAEAAAIDAARGIIADMPEIRADKVEELRQKIQDGTYKVDPEDIAAKMLAERRLAKLADE